MTYYLAKTSPNTTKMELGFQHVNLRGNKTFSSLQDRTYSKEWKHDMKQKDQKVTAGEGLTGETGLN